MAARDPADIFGLGKLADEIERRIADRKARPYDQPSAVEKKALHELIREKDAEGIIELGELIHTFPRTSERELRAYWSLLDNPHARGRHVARCLSLRIWAKTDDCRYLPTRFGATIRARELEALAKVVERAIELRDTRDPLVEIRAEIDRRVAEIKQRYAEMRAKAATEEDDFDFGPAMPGDEPED